MTLLTPAVLHCSALEHIKDESPKFHRKFVVQFALMQGIWAVILYFICFTAIFLPKVAYVRETGEKVLTNANFSSVSIKGDALSIDIKPAIWSFTLVDSTRSRSEIVVDSTGKMNRFYWDDRIEKGEVKQFNGIGLTKDWLFLKNGTQIKKIPYSKLTMGKNISMTKGQVNDFLLQHTERAQLLKYALLFAPIVFIIAVLMGALFHISYVGVVGTVLFLLTQKFSRTVSQCYKMASALYVGWAYLLVLTMIGQKIVYLTLGNISEFFLVVKTILFTAIVMIGYLCFRSIEDGFTKSSIAKVSRKTR